MKKLSVSIVIPVYNEADYLAACLDAIAAQTVQPHEVIVVDNNSTDETVEIAERYDFVTLLHAKRQGVVYARDRGFNYARGDIIGRIDGDTILAPDWVENVRTVFLDTAVATVSGQAAYYDIAGARMIDYFDTKIRQATARMFGSKVALQGANMAIRRTVWRDIRRSLCRGKGMHEDFDIAIHAYQHGYTNNFCPDLKVRICYRHATYNFKEFASYAMLSPRTYTMHGLSIGRVFYPMVLFVLAGYPTLRILSMGYNRQTRRFSWLQLLKPPAPRVNPATYGDY